MTLRSQYMPRFPAPWALLGLVPLPWQVRRAYGSTKSILSRQPSMGKEGPERKVTKVESIVTVCGLDILNVYCQALSCMF